MAAATSTLPVSHLSHFDCSRPIVECERCADLLQLLGAFDRNNEGDVDANGVTNVSDLLALLSEFGNSC